tara:strand:- start:138 stop:644 length:507 start_codon:yes stop_codon:yes gene_type:complete
MSRFLKKLCISLCTVVSCTALSQQAPYLNEVKVIDFGTILGLSGTCHLAYDTAIVSDAGGNLCPFQEVVYGTLGKYQIVAAPHTQIQIRIVDRPNNGDGITFTPAGVFQVLGLPDILIAPKTFQTVSTGDTGVITIIMGGTLVNSTPQNFNTSYLFNIESGITFNEIP